MNKKMDFKQVKIMYGFDLKSLENNINNFLITSGIIQDIINISLTFSKNQYGIIAIIVYIVKKI